MKNKDFENGFKVIIKEEPEEMVDLFSQSSKANSKRYKKKKRGPAAWWQSLKKWQRAMVVSFVSLVAIILSAVIVLLTALDYNYNSITTKPDDLGFEEVIDKRIINIALFGLDTRDQKTFKGNSDSIMVISVNTETKKVKIISIMRDSLVEINKSKGKVYNKINSAYASGGPELAIKTINQNFGLDISEYATVNFFGMIDIIDAVGGIDAELTKSEVGGPNTNYSLNGCITEICSVMKIDAKPHYVNGYGKKHLTGIQAVAYSRVRRFPNIWGTNNDFGRTDRQRYVMEQLFNKALTMDKSQYIKLAKSLIPCSETSLSYGEIMDLASKVLLHSPTFEQTRMPMDKYQMNAPSIRGVGSCVYYDLDFATDVIHAFIYDDVTPEEYVELNGIRKNDWYRKEHGGTTVTSKPTTSSEVDTSSEVSSDEDEASSDDVSSITSSDTSSTSSDEVESDTISSKEETTSSKDDFTNSEQSPDIDTDTDIDKDDEEDVTTKPSQTE